MTASDQSRVIEDAIFALRAGRPVFISDSAADNGITAVLAAERTGPERLEQLRANVSGETVLALTARRAAFLHIPPSGEDILFVVLPAGAAAAEVLALADPTRDLVQPFKGPFERVKSPVTPSARAAILLCKLAQLLPAAVMIPVPDGAAEGGLQLDADVLFEVNAARGLTLRPQTAARLPLAHARDAQIIAFRDTYGGPEQLAIVIGTGASGNVPLVRLHSECFTGDLLGSLRCDCGDQLRQAIKRIADDGNGLVLYLAQEGRGIGLINKLRAYNLQDQGFDTFEANERLGFAPDERDFAIAAHMLQALGHQEVRLLTNNPAKVRALEAEHIRVAKRIPHAFPPNVHNRDYLAAKARFSGHYLDPDADSDEPDRD